MNSVEKNAISSNMEMYLIKIKRFEDQINPVPLSLLADSLQISPVSVNEMCRKLSEMELIDYQPYKGASLTETGNARSLQILRKHRLWEVFLVEKLHFDYESAHDLSDRLEHVTPDILADRMEEFLGCPSFSPAGMEIPNPKEPCGTVDSIPLSELKVGEQAIIVNKELDQDILEFFESEKITQGSILEVLGKSARQLLLSFDNRIINISAQIATKINVIELNKSQDSEALFKEQNSLSKEVNMAEKTITKVKLNNLKIGQSGVVIGVSGSGPGKQRMMDMGLVPGSEVRVVRVAPLGDPIEINLKGYHLSLRKSEASNVEVEINQEDA